MAWTYQCGHGRCRKRYSFPKPLENYQRRPAVLNESGLCGRCGKGVLHETKLQLRRRHLRELCGCSGIPFPHRLGTSASVYSGPFAGGTYYCISYVEPKQVFHLEDIPF